jgi:hypothetical protein
MTTPPRQEHFTFPAWGIELIAVIALSFIGYSLLRQHGIPLPSGDRLTTPVRSTLPPTASLQGKTGLTAAQNTLKRAEWEQEQAQRRYLDALEALRRSEQAVFSARTAWLDLQIQAAQNLLSQENRLRQPQKPSHPSP